MVVFLAPALPLPRTMPLPLVVGGLVPAGVALDDPSATVAVAVLPAALPTIFCFLVLRDGELVDAYDSPFFLLRLGDDGADSSTLPMADAAVVRADMASAAIMAAMSLSLSLSSLVFSLGILPVFGTIAAASALPLPLPFVLDFFSELPPVDFFAFLVDVGVLVSSSLTLALVLLALALFLAQ